MGNSFHIDPQAMKRLEQEVVAKIQPKANTATQNAIRRVRDNYSGEDVDEVYQQLVQAISQETGLQLEPNEEALRPVAQSIVDGSLKD